VELPAGGNRVLLWTPPEGHPGQLAYTFVDSYPIDVSHLISHSLSAITQGIYLVVSPLI
jgi:hypothetical protein